MIVKRRKTRECVWRVSASAMPNFPPIINELGELDRVVKCALKMGERERRGNERERRGQQGRMKNDGCTKSFLSSSKLTHFIDISHYIH